MKKFVIADIGRVFGKHKDNVKKLSRDMDVRISIDKAGHEIVLESMHDDEFDEHLTEKIMDALALGFDYKEAIMLKDTDYMLREFNLKNYVKQSRLPVVKSRVIGREGKTKSVIEELGACFIAVSDRSIAIIAKAAVIDVASQAIESLIRGSPQSKVYNFLEKSRARLQELEEEDIEKTFR